MVRVLFGWVVLGAAIISGCSDSTAPMLPTPVMPLAIGNRWVYRVTGGALDTVEIVGAREVGGETWYEGSDSILYTNRADGLWTSPLGQPPIHVALANPRIGDTVVYGVASVLLPGASETVELPLVKSVTDTDSAVTVPAGKLQCDHYLLERPFAQRPNMPSELFARGIGLVARYESSFGDASRLLVQYDLH
jgi:hypothetical protein